MVGSFKGSQDDLLDSVINHHFGRHTLLDRAWKTVMVAKHRKSAVEVERSGADKARHISVMETPGAQ
jgi:molybdopterin synthase catalytic subunit